MLTPIPILLIFDTCRFCYSCVAPTFSFELNKEVLDLTPQEQKTNKKKERGEEGGQQNDNTNNKFHFTWTEVW